MEEPRDVPEAAAPEQVASVVEAGAAVVAAEHVAPVVAEAAAAATSVSTPHSLSSVSANSLASALERCRAELQHVRDLYSDATKQLGQAEGNVDLFLKALSSAQEELEAEKQRAADFDADANAAVNEAADERLARKVQVDTLLRQREATDIRVGGKY